MKSLSNLFLRPFYSFNRKASQFILERAARPAAPPKKETTPKLLYIAASCLPYHISGYTSRTHELLCAMRQENINFQAVTRPGYPWDRKDRLLADADDRHVLAGVSYAHFRQPTRLKQVTHYALAAASVLEKYALEHGITRIHAASNHVNALPGLIAARRLGIPFQYEIRGLWELTRASRQPAYLHSPAYEMGLALEGFVASHADAVFVISRQLGKYARKRWNIDPNRIRELPNCVNISQIKPNKSMEVNPRVLGYAGSLISYEGLDTLIAAIHILRGQGERLSLRVIGDGEARKDLEKMVDDLALREQITFEGRHDPEVARSMLASCGMVCIPRKPHEVCQIVTPLKLVEAMAMGKAVIAPDLPVFRDELGDCSEGWLFESGNASSLARIISEKLAQPEEIVRQGKKLLDKAAATRQWKNYVGDLLA